MPEMRRKYDSAFPEGAAPIVRETDKTIAEAARDLGFWFRRWETGQVRPGRSGESAGLKVDERAELGRLKAENAELRMECDVLKRSVVPVGEEGDALSLSEVPPNCFSGRMAACRGYRKGDRSF